MELHKMSMESTSKYCDYCCERAESERMTKIGYIVWFIIAAVFFAFWAENNKRFFLVVACALLIYCIIFAKLTRKTIDCCIHSKDEPYEYTFDIVKFDEERILFRENGEEIKYEIIKGTTSYKEGEEIVAVYSPKFQYTFTEKKEKWDEMNLE